jgi:hypothetical protein
LSSASVILRKNTSGYSLPRKNCCSGVTISIADDLLENALKKVDHRFHCEKQTQEEKQKFESAVLEKLTEDYLYEVNECLGTESQLKLKVTKCQVCRLSSGDIMY